MKTNKSGKQRRHEIKLARQIRRKTPDGQALLCWQHGQQLKRPKGAISVNPEQFQLDNSYGQPIFAARGYYVDQPFRCAGCGADEVWTAERQRWWYEVAKGYLWSTAKRCASCRAKERARKTEARRRWREGLVKKAERLAQAGK